MRIIFFGTPDFAVPSLEQFIASGDIEVSLVVTQPDRPAGRGRALQRSPVARLADQHGIEVLQPTTLNNEARAFLSRHGADLFFVAAFGRIFGPRTLTLPRFGCVNLHASLLPKYRGASPIAAAILAGDRVTGVALMQMDAGLDTGAVIATREEPIRSSDTAATLGHRLSQLGADLAVAIVPQYIAGSVLPRTQPESDASHTRLLTKSDGWLTWSESSDALERRVRAMQPWPRAWTTDDDASHQVFAATALAGGSRVEPGSIVAIRPELIVATGDGMLRLDEVQAAGGRRMPGAAFAAGRRLAIGAVLGTTGQPAPQSPLIAPITPLAEGEMA